MYWGENVQIVIAGRDPSNIEEYLSKSGHKVKCFYVNDICLDIARAFNPEVFIYMDDVVDKVPHEQALKQLQNYRVLIIAGKDNPVIPYAAALGIKDYVFHPCELETVLHRIENPATTGEAAELLRCAPQRIPDKPEPPKPKTQKPREDYRPPKEKKQREPIKINLPDFNISEKAKTLLTAIRSIQIQRKKKPKQPKRDLPALPYTGYYEPEPIIYASPQITEPEYEPTSQYMPKPFKKERRVSQQRLTSLTDYRNNGDTIGIKEVGTLFGLIIIVLILIGGACLVTFKILIGS